jgi:hypothetical protein
VWDEDAETPLRRPQSHPKGLDHSEREKLFGRLVWKPKPTKEEPGGIEVSAQWEREHLTTVRVPWTRQTAILNAPARKVHKLAAAPLAALWAEWQAEDLLPYIVTFNGIYVPRFIRGTPPGTTNPAKLSNHSWGTAFDINAQWNARGSKGAKAGELGNLPLAMVDIAAKHGWAWGGYFATTDKMHFELTRIAQPQALPVGVGHTPSK